MLGMRVGRPCVMVCIYFSLTMIQLVNLQFKLFGKLTICLLKVIFCETFGMQGRDVFK